MHQFGWLSERGGNFLNLLQKEGGTKKGGSSLTKGGDSNPGGNYVQPGKQAIAIHISSRSKGNQAMTFSQLIEYNMRNIFPEKRYTNVLEKLFPDPFLNHQS